MFLGVQKSVREWTLTLPRNSHFGIGIPVNSRIFRRRFQGSKFNGLRSSLYHWKDIEILMSKISLHDSFEHLKHKLWLKERPGVKLAIWLPTLKVKNRPEFYCVQVKCHIPLERSRQGLQLFFKTHFNQRFSDKIMGPQSHESLNFGNLGVSGQNAIWMWASWKGT
jgi:hypothetical protein